MIQQLDEAAAALAQGLRRRIGEPRFNLWFAGKTRFACEGGQLVVGVPNLFLQDWLQKTFSDDVRAVAEDAFGSQLAVRFAIDPELFQAARRREAAEPAPPATSPGPAVPAPPPRAERRGTKRQRRWRRLDDFIVGSSNRVAHAAALSAVEEPEQSPNPLVLHGPVGTGKSHLLEGVFAGLGRNRPDWRVVFVTAEEFTNRFVQAMHQGKLGAFRRHFRDCDALIVDDLHFLARKQATQEEFLHTLDALQGDGRLVIAGCDAHPRSAESFSPELADRLAGGAVWGLTTPDRATRLDVLRARFAGQMLVAEEVITFLADNLCGNVRELEGAAHSIVHLSRVTKRPADVALAREALADVLRHSVRVVCLADVERAVCTALGVGPDELRSRKRGGLSHAPRLVAMYLARKHTAATYADVGKQFGGRNHSTVVAAEKQVRRWLADEVAVRLGGRSAPAREVIERVERELLR